MVRLTPSTPLSELRQFAQRRRRSTAEFEARLVRSVEQSMRVEGYSVSEADVRSSADRILLGDNDERSSR